VTAPAVAGTEGTVRFGLAVPRSWYELELHPARRDRAIRELVEERTRGNDVMWERRHAITKLLVQQATDARASGASYCAGFSLPTDEGPVTGSITVSLVDRPADGGRVGPADTFRQLPRGTDPLAPYAETTLVDLPGAGPCARSSGIEDTPFPGGGLLRHVFMVTAVPVPGREQLFLVAASSPVLPLADALLDLFDAVTGTFTVTEDDDPTPEAEAPR
jgi:hypothetical protein